MSSHSMRPYRLTNELNCSQDVKKNIALKFDAGKVQSEKYGEATLSGHLLMLARHGDFPPVNVDLVDEHVSGWLKGGLEEYREYVYEKGINISNMVAHMAPSSRPEKLELFFKFCLFAFVFDDETKKLKHSNEASKMQLLQRVSTVLSGFVAIIERYGDDKVAEVAAGENPTFEKSCLLLSHVCQRCFQQMPADVYVNFAKEVMYYIRATKWQQEFFRGKTPYNENDYFLFRGGDSGVATAAYLVFFANDIRISDQIRAHPIFQRYYTNISLSSGLVNDLLSVKKEIAEREIESLVFLKCRKYSLQESIFKAEEAANRLMIELKIDAVRLKSYFPADRSLQKVVEILEFIADGLTYWYPYTRRYGDIEFTKYVVEYDSDYSNWFDETDITNSEAMKEPVLRLGSNHDLLVFPSLS